MSTAEPPPPQCPPRATPSLLPVHCPTHCGSVFLLFIPDICSSSYFQFSEFAEPIFSPANSTRESLLLHILSLILSSPRLFSILYLSCRSMCLVGVLIGIVLRTNEVEFHVLIGLLNILFYEVPVQLVCLCSLLIIRYLLTTL